MRVHCTQYLQFTTYKQIATATCNIYQSLSNGRTLTDIVTDSSPFFSVFRYFCSFLLWTSTSQWLFSPSHAAAAKILGIVYVRYMLRRLVYTYGPTDERDLELGSYCCYCTVLEIWCRFRDVFENPCLCRWLLEERYSKVAHSIEKMWNY